MQTKFQKKKKKSIEKEEVKETKTEEDQVEDDLSAFYADVGSDLLQAEPEVFSVPGIVKTIEPESSPTNTQINQDQDQTSLKKEKQEEVEKIETVEKKERNEPETTNQEQKTNGSNTENQIQEQEKPSNETLTPAILSQIQAQVQNKIQNLLQNPKFQHLSKPQSQESNSDQMEISVNLQFIIIIF